jgi:phosphoglycerate dehydrogenase-like enzyme
MRLKARYPNPVSADVLDDLRRRVPPNVEIIGFGETAESADILIEGRPSAQDLDSPSGLRAVIVPFAGVPMDTLRLVRERPGISLHNCHHNAPETAELAMTLLLAAAKRLVPMDRALRKNDWTPRYDASDVQRLSGRRAVVLGFGEVGRRVAQACLCLGMRVAATRRSLRSPEEHGGIEVLPATATKELLAEAEALVIALPLTRETDGLLGAEELALLPRSAIIVNVARAQIVDEAALFEALSEGRILAAGLDVWYSYPPPDPPASEGPLPAADVGVTSYLRAPSSASSHSPSAFPFGTLDNVVLSPHRGGASSTSESSRVAALAQMLTLAADGKEIPFRVDLEAGY